MPPPPGGRCMHGARGQGGSRRGKGRSQPAMGGKDHRGCPSRPGGSSAHVTCPGGSPAPGRSAPPCKSSGICRPGPSRRAAAGSGSGSPTAAAPGRRAGLPARQLSLLRAPWAPPNRSRWKRRRSRPRPRCRRRRRLPQRRRRRTRRRRRSSPSPPAPWWLRCLPARRGHRRLPLPSPPGPSHGEAAKAAAATLEAAHPPRPGPGMREHPSPPLKRRLEALGCPLALRLGAQRRPTGAPCRRRARRALGRTV